MNSTIQEKFNGYKNWLLANNKAQNTINNYVPKVKDFLETLNIENLSDITSEMIINYCAKQKATGGQEKANQILKSLRSFLVKCNGIETLKFPDQKMNVSRKVKKPITEKELGEVIRPQLDYLFKNPLQVKALFYFMFYTGLRKEEIVNLKRQDFDLDNNKVTAFASKQTMQRVVPINQNLKILLNKFFGTMAEEDNAFNVSEKMIEDWVAKIEESEVLGKGRKIWPHLFRDSYACLCLKNKISLPRLKTLMGHKNVEETMKYLTLCESDEHKEFLDKIKGIQ